MMGSSPPVIIIGAGVSGLAAGITLKESGYRVLVIESSNRVGGRVGSDLVNGYILDRGFQVLLKAYPEAAHFLRYEDLQLRKFLPGARVLTEKGNYMVMDPSRAPLFLLKTLSAPTGTLLDKLKMLQLRLSLLARDPESLFLKPEISTMEYLKNYGFSEPCIERFFMPFLGGIFLENALQTSSRMFEWVYRLFGIGDTVVPAMGMQEIPNQMANRIGWESIRLNEKVLEVEKGWVVTEKEKIPAQAIFFAGGRMESYPGNLSGNFQHPVPGYNVRSGLTLYFSSETCPVIENIIVLNSVKSAWVNTVAVMNQVSGFYAPKNSYLISITLKNAHTVLDIDSLIQEVKKEMAFWFPEAMQWEFIKSYSIPYALPDQDHVVNTLPNYQLEDSVWVCGDFLLNGSINAAMKSGRMAAEQYMAKLV